MSDQKPQGQAKRSRNRRGGGNRTDPWAPVPALPEAAPIAPANDPTALLRSLGDPPLQGRSIVAGHYLAAVTERAATLATALATAAGQLEPVDPDEYRVIETLVWRDGPVEPGPAVVVDLDGTVADAAGRQHFLDRTPKDWAGFFADVGRDPVLAHVARLLDCLDPDLLVVLLTGRPARTTEQTVEWLARAGVGWDLLVLRTDRDFRPAPETKREAVRALTAVGFDLRLALDDDRRNVAMFESEGIPCVWISDHREPPTTR